jgi:hypothetical protein
MEAAKRAWIKDVPQRGSLLLDDASSSFAFVPFDPSSSSSSSDRGAVAAIEKVRTSTFNVLEDTYFDANSASPTGLVNQLYLALAYIDDANGEHPACGQDDVRDALEAYEAGLFAEPPAVSTSASAKMIDPLYFLAHARLAKLASNDAAALFLLSHFHSKFQGLAKSVADGGWCNDAEMALLAVPKSHPTVQSSSWDGGGGASEGSETSAFAPGSLEAIWEETKKIGELTEDQIKPMDELFELTGLKEVKAVALKIYRGVLADRKLIEDGKTDAVGERVLNFSFLGNPGTGKSTVGRLFSELLEASGARVR